MAQSTTINLSNAIPFIKVTQVSWDSNGDPFPNPETVYLRVLESGTFQTWNVEFQAFQPEDPNDGPDRWIVRAGGTSLAFIEGPQDQATKDLALERLVEIIVGVGGEIFEAENN